MRYSMTLLLVLTAACGDSWHDYPDASTPRCPVPSRADAVTGSIEVPVSNAAPLASDLVVRGTVKAWRDDVTVTKVLVDGIPATHDGSSYSTFDATVPLALLQAEATARGTPTSTTVDVTAVTDCNDVVPVTQIPITLRAVTDSAFTLTLEPIAAGYVPSSFGVPAVFDLSANAEAAGMPITATASQGAVTAPSVLPGDGVHPITTKIYLTADPTKQGTAVVQVQIGGITRSASVPIVGPPTLNPQSATIARGSAELEVFVNNTLPASAVAKSIQGCAATIGTGMRVHVGPNDISGQGLTRLVATDVPGHPIFRVAALSVPTTPASVSVTCYDVYNQSVTGVYSAQ